MPSRIADRIAVARSRVFVGRAAESRLFQEALAAADLPFCLLYVFGPGGVGKTTLLQSLAALCDAAGVPCARVDAREVDPSPPAFLDALRAALSLPEGSDPLTFLDRQPARRVVFVDTFELLEGMSVWFTDVFLPQLPAETLIVTAGRQPPPTAWRADAGWQQVIRSVNLRNLSPDESRDYLIRREIPVAAHEAALRFTHGHPLALSLLADLYAQQHASTENAPLFPEASPDIVQALLARFVSEAPSPVHRLALEASALVRVTNEPLLTAMLAEGGDGAIPPLPPDKDSGIGTRAAALFSWLNGLSFMEAGADGLHPHDIAREALSADLRWRNRDRYSELHRRARAFFAARLRDAPPEQQQRLLYDCIFLHRDNTVVRTAFTWQETPPSVYADRLRGPEDATAVVALVERHEGPEAARVARHWLARQPEATVVFRDATEADRAGGPPPPAAFLTMLALERADENDRAADPAARAAWEYMERTAPLRPGEGAAHLRFWMTRDSYQEISPLQSLLIVHALRHYLTRPRLCCTFFACRNPEFWEPVFGYAEIERLENAAFTQDGRRYGVYGHDWRAVPVTAWLTRLAEKETEDSAAPAAAPPAASTAPTSTPPPLIVLSEPDFRAAVREALKSYAAPDRLRHNPLLQSRIISEAAGGPNAGLPERIEALRSLLRTATDPAEATIRRLERGRRAVWQTYVDAPTTQEDAADRLDLPFSTYRRHLLEGLDAVAGGLWRQEIGEN